MVQLVQLLNRLLFLFFIILSGCKSSEQDGHEGYIWINKINTDFKFVNGLLQINGMPFTGTIFSLYSNNIDTAEITTYYKGREHGEWKKYYEDGKMKETRKFSLGKKTGNYLTWWPNGKKQLHYFFVNDEYEGNCKEWNENGLLTKDMNYKRSLEDGMQRWWYDNGKIKANYIIKDGRRYGLLGTKNCINVSDSIFKD